MQLLSTRLPYRQTRAFSGIILDYLDQLEAIRPFFQHPPTKQGILHAVEARRSFATDRNTLVQVLEEQYAGMPVDARVGENIRALSQENVFTVATAHQNNLFTGPLYVVYKIVHAIRLAAVLNGMDTGNRFVPVFYLGTEDADLDELNHAWIGGEKLVWETRQTGAVGRMKADKQLEGLVERAAGQLSVLPYGMEVVALLREHFREGRTIQQATFGLLNALFGEYGLVVLLPDHPSLKKQLHDIFRDDLLNQSASAIVGKANEQLGQAGFKVQAHPREINLFYLDGDRRDRIEKKGGEWTVMGTDLRFTEAQLLAELKERPDRFSPNVILRGLYQETILPNVAFIGGGGETAYWLQLKNLFEHYQVPFPVLVLRNSFLVIEQKWLAKLQSLGLQPEDLFEPAQTLLNRMVKRDTKHELSLRDEMAGLEEVYDAISQKSAAIDPTLAEHVAALRGKALRRLQELEKKMLRAERRKFTNEQAQLAALHGALFPGDGLQERRDNFSQYYARWGREFIGALLDHSLSLEQEFTILLEQLP